MASKVSMVSIQKILKHMEENLSDLDREIKMISNQEKEKEDLYVEIMGTFEIEARKEVQDLKVQFLSHLNCTTVDV